MVGRHFLEATIGLSGIIHIFYSCIVEPSYRDYTSNLMVCMGTVDDRVLGSGKDEIVDHCQTLMWKRPRLLFPRIKCSVTIQLKAIACYRY